MLFNLKPAAHDLLHLPNAIIIHFRAFTKTGTRNAQKSF